MNQMQKVRKSVNIVLIICFYLIFQNCAGQSNIDNVDDFAVLNKTVTKYFESLSEEDAILLRRLKKEGDSIRIKDYLKRKENRNDTLYIAKITDPFYYQFFLTKEAYWTRLKQNEHILEKYDTLLFKDMYKQYERQLGDTINYYWKDSHLTDSSPVKFLNNFKYTQKEMRSMDLEKRGRIDLNFRITAMEKKVYFFTKPLYSSDNKYAIIVFSNLSKSHNVLFLFERISHEWILREGISTRGYL